MSGRRLAAEAAVALGFTALATFMSLHEVGNFLLDDVGNGDWVRDRNMDGVGLLNVHGHLVGDGHLVGYLHRVWHFLLYGVWDLLLHIHGVGLHNFHRVGLLDLDLNGHLHGVGDLLFYGDGVGFFYGYFDLLVDDDGLHLLVWAAEACLGIALGMAVALRTALAATSERTALAASSERSTEVAKLGGRAGHQGQYTNLSNNKITLIQYAIKLHYTLCVGLRYKNYLQME